MLFLELALIRWLGANVVHLSYFSNFVLLGSFLGIGIGFLVAEELVAAPPSSPPLLAALVVVRADLPRGIHASGQRRHLLHRTEPAARLPGSRCR